MFIVMTTILSGMIMFDMSSFLSHWIIIIIGGRYVETGKSFIFARSEIAIGWKIQWAAILCKGW